jgi:2,4-diaminopentanoate dehydrogenase
MTTDRIRVALVGLGATGLEAGRAVLGREDAELVAAVDIDPAKAGRPLGELLRRPDAPDVRVGAELAGVTREHADVAVVTVGSTLTSVVPVLERIAAAGVDAVSLCEELGYPWFDEPALAGRLHRHAEQHGVSILGTGANPGFLMDTLPIALSAALQVVDRVSIERTTDLSPYGPLLGKFGFGLTPAEHAARAGDDVVGHIGFRQSIAQLAHALGWELDAIEVAAPEPLVVTGARRNGAFLQLDPGTVAAVVHRAAGVLDGERVIRCEARFGFLAPEDDLVPGDRWTLEGGGRRVEVAAPGGFESWATTIAVLANLIGPVVAAPPGLLTMSDIPVGALAAKGARLAAPARPAALAAGEAARP